jgi:hypothetical protein
VRLLVRLEQELAEIHDPADWRHGGWRNLHEVHPGFLSHLQRRFAAQYSNLFATGTDDANFPRINLFIAPDSFVCSDMSTLHNNAAATRNLGGEALDQPIERHCAQVCASRSPTTSK